MEMRRGFFVFVMALAAVSVRAANGWSWEMPGDVYKELDFSCRAGVDRAARIFSEACDAERRGMRTMDLIPRYRAAVAEWRKVQIQAEAENFDETLIAYATFMQAYARERAHDRHEAIKLYNEVIELHPDVKWVVFPAEYRLASCAFDLGENKKGHRLIDAFIEDPEHDGHVLMADALNRQAWRLWNEGRYAEAQADWYRILEGKYASSNWQLWCGVRDLLVTTSLVTCEFDRFDELVFAGVKDDDDKGRYERTSWALDRVYGCIVHGHCGFHDRLRERYPKESERNGQLAKAKKWFVGWFDRCGPLYEKANRRVDYLFKTVRVRLAFASEEEALKAFARVRDYLKGEKDEKTVNARANEAIDLAFDFGKVDLARAIPDLMRGRFAPAWTRYAVENRAQNWKKAVKLLEDYMSLKPEADALRRAKWDLAYLCRERIGDVERAVKIYQELDDPPETLWALVECYRRLGKKTDSYRLLDEIASIFEKEAAHAIWVHGQYLEQDGDKQKAIALYRRLLSHPAWKQTRESSQAHQALERLGIATGGAMTNEVR